MTRTIQKALWLLSVALLANAAHAVETLNVLMIGNSYTSLGGEWSTVWPNVEGFLDGDPDLEANNPLIPPFGPAQRRFQGPPARSKCLGTSQSPEKCAPR